MTAVAEQAGAWLEHFTNQPPAPAVVQPLRDAAFARFAELGFPTTHNEEWRFTNVAPIARTRFAAGRKGTVGIDARVARGPIQLVFANGHLLTRPESPRPRGCSPSAMPPSRVSRSSASPRRTTKSAPPPIPHPPRAPGPPRGARARWESTPGLPGAPGVDSDRA